MVYIFHRKIIIECSRENHENNTTIVFVYYGNFSNQTNAIFSILLKEIPYDVIIKIISNNNHDIISHFNDIEDEYMLDNNLYESEFKKYLTYYLLNHPITQLWNKLYNEFKSLIYGSEENKNKKLIQAFRQLMD